MKGPESKVKKSIRKVLDSLGADCWYFMPASYGYGRSGVPDFVGIYKGHGFAIEAKAGGRTPTALQADELNAVKVAGGMSIVVDETVPDNLLRRVMEGLDTAH
jgi:hypothetical protein